MMADRRTVIIRRCGWPLQMLLFACVICISARTSFAAPIPTDVKKAVAFVFAADAHGNPAIREPLGTGFFVGVPAAEPNKSYVYFVTAKHVLHSADNGTMLQRVFLRMNARDGSARFIDVPLKTTSPGKTLYFHNDSSVDLAVIPVKVTGDLDYKFIRREFLTSKDEFEKLNIVEGTEVFFAGLFTPYLGQKRNYPVVRFGRVALMTDERIVWGVTPTGLRRPTAMDLYLMESASYGGNSGSPVFFYSGDNVQGYSLFKLAGVMMGTYLEQSPIRMIDVPTQTKRVPVSTANVGIAAVVPCFKLYEILLGPELQALRAP